MSDVYYNPEDHGLEIVGEISFDDDSYQFEMGVVWWHPERRAFFYATDSGCSCPSPFEDYLSVDDLGEPLDLSKLTARLRALKLPDYVGSPPAPLPVQVQPIIDRARELVQP